MFTQYWVFSAFSFSCVFASLHIISTYGINEVLNFNFLSRKTDKVNLKANSIFSLNFALK